MLKWIVVVLFVGFSIDYSKFLVEEPSLQMLLPLFEATNNIIMPSYLNKIYLTILFIFSVFYLTGCAFAQCRKKSNNDYQICIESR